MDTTSFFQHLDSCSFTKFRLHGYSNTTKWRRPRICSEKFCHRYSSYIAKHTRLIVHNHGEHEIVFTVYKWTHLLMFANQFGSLDTSKLPFKPFIRIVRLAITSNNMLLQQMFRRINDRVLNSELYRTASLLEETKSNGIG